MNNVEYEKYLSSLSYGELIEIKTELSENSNRGRIGAVYSEIYKRFPELNKSKSKLSNPLKKEDIIQTYIPTFENSPAQTFKELCWFLFSGLFILIFNTFLSMDSTVLIAFSFPLLFVLSIPSLWYFKFRCKTLCINKNEKTLYMIDHNEITHFHINDVLFIEQEVSIGAYWRYGLKILFRIHLVDGQIVLIPNSIENRELLKKIVLRELSLDQKVI